LNLDILKMFPEQLKSLIGHVGMEVRYTLAKILHDDTVESEVVEVVVTVAVEVRDHVAEAVAAATDVLLPDDDTLNLDLNPETVHPQLHPKENPLLLQNPPDLNLKNVVLNLLLPL